MTYKFDASKNEIYITKDGETATFYYKEIFIFGDSLYYDRKNVTFNVKEASEIAGNTYRRGTTIFKFEKDGKYSREYLYKGNIKKDIGFYFVNAKHKALLTISRDYVDGYGYDKDSFFEYDEEGKKDYDREYKKD